MTNVDKLTYYINDCKKHGVEVLGPDINYGEQAFAVQNGAIRFGLGGVKSVGDNAVEQLLAERHRNGLYSSILDFCKRVDSRVVNKRLLESLIRCGAMDSFKENRNQLLAMYEGAQSLGQRLQKEEARGAMSLFGDEPSVAETIEVPKLDDLTMDEKLRDEKEYTGFYISGHPLNSYEAELKGLFEVGKLNENPEQYDKQEVTVGGLIVEKTDRITRRNDVMSIIRLEDFSGSASIVVFPQKFQQYQAMLAVDMAVRISGRIDADEKGVQIIADTIKR